MYTLARIASSCVRLFTKRLHRLIVLLVLQGKFAIIKDCARIADNTVLPANTVVPALALFAGVPGRFVEDLPETTQELVEMQTKQYYQRFQPIEPES